MTQETIEITNPDLKQAVHYIDLTDKVLGYDGQVPEAERQDAINQQAEQILSRIVAITNLIPSTAGPTNMLATTNDAASFKGNFDKWDDVPLNSWDDPELGDPPSKNDYIIVISSIGYGNQFNDLVLWEVGNTINPDAHTTYDVFMSGENKTRYYIYNGSSPLVISASTPTPDQNADFADVTNEKYDGCWRFKYIQESSITYNRAYFSPEYSISSTHTPAEEVVFQSGINSQKVHDYDEHLANNQLHIYNQNRKDAVDSGITSALVAQITTNKNNIATNAGNITTNANNIATINDKIPSTATSSQKLRTSKQIITKSASETFVSNFAVDSVIIATGANSTITIQSQGTENGREITIIPTVSTVHLKINGDATAGMQLTANTAYTYTWSNNRWNMSGGQGVFQNTVTLTGKYTDGTQFTFVIPAVSVS